jgi:hypothetical protein
MCDDARSAWFGKRMQVMHTAVNNAGMAKDEKMLPIGQFQPTNMPITSGPTKEPSRPTAMAQPTPVDRTDAG